MEMERRDWGRAWWTARLIAVAVAAAGAEAADVCRSGLKRRRTMLRDLGKHRWVFLLRGVRSTIEDAEARVAEAADAAQD